MVNRMGSRGKRSVLVKPRHTLCYVSLTIRRLAMHVAFFFLTFFFMIPIALIRSFPHNHHREVEKKLITSVIQGFLPGIVLKLFIIFLPSILMLVSKFEGFVSLSLLGRRAAILYYVFNLVNVFLGSINTGSAFEQLDSFLKQSVNQYSISCF